MSGDIVDYVNEMNPWVYRQDDPLHNADVFILKAKIGEQGYDGNPFHNLTV